MCKGIRNQSKPSCVLRRWIVLKTDGKFAGLVFFAFAFNMVDCGGLLGGRLGNNINMHAASLKKAKVCASVKSHPHGDIAMCSLLSAGVHVECFPAF